LDKVKTTVYHSSKRLFDLLASFIGLLILSPLFIFIASLVKLGTSGPIFYRGVRTGLHGEPFKIFKFRTMLPDAEMLGGQVTTKDDPRVTRLGKSLRRYKLDELPQLINVLKGDMSIVGPRPEVQEYTQLYTEKERLILQVRPGITDYASIEFVQLDEVVGSESHGLVFEKRVQQILSVKNSLRLKYVKEQTFSGDIKIIIMTLVKLVKSL